MNNTAAPPVATELMCLHWNELIGVGVSTLFLWPWPNSTRGGGEWSTGHKACVKQKQKTKPKLPCSFQPQLYTVDSANLSLSRMSVVWCGVM